RPLPRPCRTETVMGPPPPFAVARSGLPSPLRSPTATELGPLPVSNDRNGAAKRGAATARGVVVVARPTASNSPGIDRNRVDLRIDMRASSVIDATESRPRPRQSVASLYTRGILIRDDAMQYSRASVN